MEFKFISEHPVNCDCDSLVLFYPQYDKISDKILNELDAACGGAVTTLLSSEEFSGKEGQIATLLHPIGFQTKRVILTGLGENKKIDADSYRRACGRLSKNSGLLNSQSAVLHFGDVENDRYFQGAIEGYFLGGYKQLEFKTGDAAEDNNKVKSITFSINNKHLLKKLENSINRGLFFAEGQILVRQLANTPANHLTPVMLARTSEKLAKKHGLKIKILDEKAIQKEKMDALLAVAKGSAESPKFIILEYNGGGAKQKPIVLLGKGVTFDSGGVSIKSALDMHEMRGDMAGAATVLAAIVVAARLKLKQNIVALMPAAENMPSGTSYRPGDVIGSRKGLTIEIMNTDAEGRLLLADGLDYANVFNPQAVLDIATLTGAATYILGYAGAPILSNNKKFIERAYEASDSTAERVWELPIWDYHRDQMKSSLADLKNSGGKYAGTIAASAFLENFIGDWPWLHIDIASVDQEPKGRPYIPVGTTGFGLRTIVEMLSNWRKL